MLDHLMYAKLSSAAYDGRSAFYELGCSEVEQLCSRETRCAVYLVKHGMQYILVFRGTSDKQDILDDVRRFRIRTKDGWYIHRGFLERWRTIEANIVAMVASVAKGSLNLGFSGHSLGGALASLALIKNVSGKAGICHSAACPTITFGQPKIGGVNVAKQLTELGAIRYVNQGDLVTKIPTIGYEHGGVEMDLPGWLEEDYSMWSIFKNHGIDSYIKRLEKIKASI